MASTTIGSTGLRRFLAAAGAATEAGADCAGAGGASRASAVGASATAATFASSASAFSLTIRATLLFQLLDMAITDLGAIDRTERFGSVDINLFCRHIKMHRTHRFDFF
ncbi:UNVERIFIED_ORG: hypothetical protein GGE13_002356 [Rhizobium etli]